jgi:hypothetical protein
MSPADSAASPKGLLLIAEDERFMAYYVRLVLSQDGYDVAAAFNARNKRTATMAASTDQSSDPTQAKGRIIY